MVEEQMKVEPHLIPYYQNIQPLPQGVNGGVKMYHLASD